MGILADSVLNAGGTAHGIITDRLHQRGHSHAGLTRHEIVATLRTRKERMADLVDAFIAMPGGFGTFEEFCEIITWAQLGLHRKPCGILNVEGYYDPLLSLFDQAVSEGFVHPENRQIIIQETDPERLLDKFATFTPPETERWIDRDES